MANSGTDVSQATMITGSSLEQQLIIGVTVGATCLLLWTVIIFAVLVARHSAKKDRQRREIEDQRNRPPDLHPIPDHMGLESRLGEHRQQANFQHLAFSSRSFSPGRPAADTPTFLDGFSPRMLPLHGYNEPFVGRHKDEFSITGLTSVSSSVRSGVPAIVPFRSSQLPLRDNIQFSYEGRVNAYSRQASQESEASRRNVIYDDPPDRHQRKSKQQHRKASTGSRKLSSSSSSTQEYEMTSPTRRGRRQSNSAIKHGFTTWSIRPQENPIGPTSDRHRYEVRDRGGSPIPGRPSNSSTETHASDVHESSHGASVYSEVPAWVTQVGRPSNSSTETHASGPKASSAGMLHRGSDDVIGAVSSRFLPEEEPDPGYLPSWTSNSLGWSHHVLSSVPGSSNHGSSYGVRPKDGHFYSPSPPLSRPPPLSRNPTEASLNIDDDDNVWLPRNSPSLQRTAGSLLGYSAAHSDCSSSSGSDLHHRSNIPSFVAAEFDRIMEPSQPVNIPRAESGFRVEVQSKTVEYPLPDSGYYDDLLHRSSPPR